MMSKRFNVACLLGATLVIGVACNEKGIGYGDPNSIIAVVSAEQWLDVSDDLYDALEQKITTVRDEKTFTVTHQAPYADHWVNLRRFRQMLVMGSRSEPIVQEVLDEARDPVTGDGIHQVHDVWSIGQTITLVILPDGWGADDLRPYLPEVHELLDGQYRSYAMNRMYMSGIDSALADTLSTEEGFVLYLPSVYRWRRTDSVFVFRNDNPDPSELIREIAVTWLSPAPATVSSEALLEWRAELVADHYSEPQDVALMGMTEDASDFQGSDAFEVQAQWLNPPERGWPAGGPFITRAITCDNQDRTYLVDAWLYAPAKEKYEYMIQLETILDTFRCGG